MKNQNELTPEIKEAIEFLINWRHAMSYNDSYFGESEGKLKQLAYALNRSQS